jgi:hypothetical protein
LEKWRKLFRKEENVLQESERKIDRRRFEEKLLKEKVRMKNLQGRSASIDLLRIFLIWNVSDWLVLNEAHAAEYVFFSVT